MKRDGIEEMENRELPAGTSNDLPAGAGVGVGVGNEPKNGNGSDASLTCLSTPTGNSGTPSDIDLMLGEYAAGNLIPIEVELGPMPARAGATMNAIAEHMRLLMGLRLAVGEARALPYAVSVPVQAGLATDAGTASKAIRSLVRFGVVKHVGALPPLRPGLPGTKLYEPPNGMRGDA